MSKYGSTHPCGGLGFTFCLVARTAKSEKKNHLKFAIQSSSLAVMRPETGVLGTRLLLVDLAGQLLKPESESLLQIRTPQLGGGCEVRVCLHIALFLAKIVSSLRQEIRSLCQPMKLSHSHHPCPTSTLMRQHNRKRENEKI